MIDCPTGAIGRDPDGEVFIREEICTGCEACAKACPWDNIQIAPAPAAHTYPQVAVKCDLCHGYNGTSACVANCPTGAIIRLDPLTESASLQAMLGAAAPTGKASNTTSSASRRAPLTTPLLLAAVALFGTAGAVAHTRGALAPYAGMGLWSGIAGALTIFALAAFGVRKRFIKRWMKRRREASAKPLQPLSRWYNAHLVLGGALIAFVMLHTGGGFGGGLTTSLMIALIASTLLGATGAVLYRLVPPRIARLVSAPHLPEDHRKEHHRLDFELRETLSRRPEAQKRFDATLAPLWNNRGAIWSTLREGPDRHALRERLENLARTPDLDAANTHAIEKAARITTEHIALHVERLGSRLLAANLLPHLLASSTALAFLLVHAIQGVLWL